MDLPKNDRLSRVRGTLLGGAIGDALGSGIEFLSLSTIRGQFGAAGVTGFVSAYGRANAITDDTQMTLFTAEALLSADGDEEFILELEFQYKAWARHQGVHVSGLGDRKSGLESHPAMTAQRAPGNSCLSGLRAPGTGTLTDPKNPRSKGCGAVMRAAPFGLRSNDAEQAWNHAILGSVLTHGHPSGYFSAAALAWMVHELIAGQSLEVAVRSALERLERAGAPAKECASVIHQACEISANGPVSPETLETLGAGWTGEEALGLAVCAALAFQESGVRASLLAAVNHSGDSDSTGSICGNLVGAAYGLSALPQDWVHEVEARDLILWVADRLGTVEAVDEEMKRCAEAALTQVSWDYRAIGATELAANANGHHWHHGMFMAWVWGRDGDGCFLDFLCDHRLSSMKADRFREDGTSEPIETPVQFRTISPDPKEDAELERTYFERNRTRYENLRRRGLLPSEENNGSSLRINEILRSGGGVKQDE